MSISGESPVKPISTSLPTAWRNSYSVATSTVLAFLNKSWSLRIFVLSFDVFLVAIPPSVSGAVTRSELDNSTSPPYPASIIITRSTALAAVSPATSILTSSNPPGSTFNQRNALFIILVIVSFVIVLLVGVVWANRSSLCQNRRRRCSPRSYRVTPDYSVYNLEPAVVQQHQKQQQQQQQLRRNSHSMPKSDALDFGEGVNGVKLMRLKHDEERRETPEFVNFSAPIKGILRNNQMPDDARHDGKVDEKANEIARGTDNDNSKSNSNSNINNNNKSVNKAKDATIERVRRKRSSTSLISPNGGNNDDRDQGHLLQSSNYS